MPHSQALSQWSETVSTAFPNLSRPQARVLAYWSFGMVLAKACGISVVCAALALQLGCAEASLVQRLREWCYRAKDKKGTRRRELDVSTCFAPLLRWILQPLARRKATARARPRMLSCFARGIIMIVGMLIRGDGLVGGPLRGGTVANLASCSPKEEHQDQVSCGSGGRLMKNLLLVKALSVRPEERLFWQAAMRELVANLTRADMVSSFDETIDYRLHYRFTPGDLDAWPGKVLILQSDDDPATTPAMQMALRALYPQAQVHTFHQAGHTPFLSQPDEFYPLVQTFLLRP